MKVLRLILSGLLVSFLLVGCGGGSSSSDDAAATSSDDTATTGSTATITHMDGFDFSESGVPVDYQSSDGESIGWPPSPNNWVDTTNDPGVWFRPNANTSTASYTKDMGEVSLAGVSSVPSSWDGGAGMDLPPLQVGHVYVVKCLDGYAKFLVKSIDTTSWDVAIEYQYSSGTTF